MKTITRSRRFNLLFATAVTIAGVSGAVRDVYALQGGEDPALLPVLIDKRFGGDHRHQVGLTFSTAMATKFIEATGGHLTYTYNFSDLLGLELGGGFFLGRESSIMTQVRENFPDQEPPLTDLYQMQWFVNADVMLVPLYGKMSFASEVDPAYDLFLVAGAGVAGLRRQVGAKELNTFDAKVAPAFNFGLGLRFYFNKWVALRLELRDYFYPEQDQGLKADGTPKGGFTFNLHFQGGVQFTFGGES